LVVEKRAFSVIRRFGHGFLLWKNVIFTFDSNLCYLIETELRQLHRRFGHLFVRQLFNLLERSGHDVKKSIMKKLIRFCAFCQKHSRSSERFKFILKNDVNFNFFIMMNIMYIDNSLILHVIDEAIRFQAIKWLQNINAKHIWEMLRLC
jgi:hypothetical protein